MGETDLIIYVNGICIRIGDNGDGGQRRATIEV